VPFSELKIVEDDIFLFMVDSFFATDRLDIPKGMIEALL